MEKERIKRLQWFLKFMATDLKKLKMEDYKQLISEASYHLMLGKAEIVSPAFLANIKDKKFKEEFEVWLSETYDSNPGAENYLLGATLPSLQAALKEGSRDIFARIETVKNGDKNAISFINAETRSLACETSIKENQAEPYFSNREYFIESSYNVIVFQFMRCLHDIPISAFRKCPECENWFVNVTKREKTYCTNLCASRYIVREKRKDPESLKLDRKQGAKRARKSYERKVRAKSGKNVKITRRPRKK
jgi:hypothetical protein